MHEMAITQGIVEIGEKNCGGRKIISLDVDIGELSGIVPEALEFCFEACSHGTLLDGAHLLIHLIPGSGHCIYCSQVTVLENIFDPCSHCGSHLVEILSGQEMRVREIEIED